MFKILFLPLLVIAAVFAGVLISFGMKAANNIDPELTQGVVKFTAKWLIGVIGLWLMAELIASLLLLWLVTTLVSR